MSRYDRDDERAELRKLIARYDERAEHWQREYMDSGMPSQERAWMRNERMADALRDALNGKGAKDELFDLKIRVMELDTRDLLKLRKQAEALQRMVGGVLESPKQTKER